MCIVQKFILQSLPCLKVLICTSGDQTAVCLKLKSHFMIVT